MTPTKQPRNPNPFTERKIRFISAVRTRLNLIDNPTDIITPERYTWIVCAIVPFGKIPKLKFSPHPNRIKAEIMRNAGLVDGISPSRKENIRAIYEKYDIVTARRKEDVILADLFNKEWNELMFAFKRAVFTSGYLNHVFAKTNQSLSDPAKLMQAIVKEEYGAVLGREK